MGVDIAVDMSWVFAFVLAAWPLVTVRGRQLPALSSPGMLTLLSVAAAIGLFASLAFHELAERIDVERDPAAPRRRIDTYASSRAQENV